MSELNKIKDASEDAMNRAITSMHNWPKYNSAHEGLGILLEEVHELQQQVFLKQKLRSTFDMRNEAIDVAAVAIRFAANICNEETIRK